MPPRSTPFCRETSASLTTQRSLVNSVLGNLLSLHLHDFLTLCLSSSSSYTCRSVRMCREGLHVSACSHLLVASGRMKKKKKEKTGREKREGLLGTLLLLDCSLLLDMGSLSFLDRDSPTRLLCSSRSPFLSLSSSILCLSWQASVLLRNACLSTLLFLEVSACLRVLFLHLPSKNFPLFRLSSSLPFGSLSVSSSSFFFFFHLLFLGTTLVLSPAFSLSVPRSVSSSFSPGLIVGIECISTSSISMTISIFAACRRRRSSS